MKAIRLLVASIIATWAAGYGVAVGVVFFNQDSLMYFPDERRPDRVAAGVEDMAEIALRTADGLELLSWYKPPAQGNGVTIVYFHGNGGNIGRIGYKVRPLLDAGYGVLLFDYRGYGGNGGAPSEQGFYADGRAALDFLSSRGVPGKQIAVYGESLGTGVAVQMAVERPVGAVILEAPYTSTVDLGAERYPYLPVRLLARDRFESIRKIADVGAPLLVFHGEADRLIPARYGRELLAAAREPKEGVFVPGAGHANLPQHGGARIVLDFLGRRFGWGGALAPDYGSDVQRVR